MKFRSENEVGTVTSKCLYKTKSSDGRMLCVIEIEIELNYNNDAVVEGVVISMLRL